MTYGKYTVLFETSGEFYKLAKIWFGADGSYYVTSPYHPAKRAHAFIRSISYPQGGPVPGSERNFIDEAVADDDGKRLKMSHHPDGFLQFSGQGIISGRDRKGNPKGIGIVTWPLMRPQLGPAFGITIIGVEAYEKVAKPPQNSVIFHDSEMASVPGASGLILEGFYRPAGWRRFLELDFSGGWRLRQVHPVRTILELRVMLASERCAMPGFIGMSAMRAPTFIRGADSGFILSGSTGNLRYENKTLVGDGIYCAYPAQVSGDARSLNLVLDDPPYTVGEGGEGEGLKPTRQRIAEAFDKLTHGQDKA